MIRQFTEGSLVVSKHAKMFTNTGMHIKTKYFPHTRMAEVCHYQILERIENNHSHTQLLECTLKSNNS